MYRYFFGLVIACVLHNGSAVLFAATEVETETASTPADKKEAGSAEKSATRSEPKPEAKKVRLAHIAIQGLLPESPGEMSLFGDLGVDLRKNVARLDKAADDASIAGVVLQIDNEIPRGKLHELREAIHRVQAAGKKVYAVLESAQGSQYLLATACDEISMPESGVVVAPGVHAEFAFYKDLLAKLGIEADMLHCGDFKGAAEPYTRDSLSEPVRQNMTALIDDFFDQMVSTIAADRELKVEEVRTAIDRGLLTAREAKKAGLIDRVAYPDEIRAQLAKDYRADKLVYVENYSKQKLDADFSGPMGMMKFFQSVLGGAGNERGSSKSKLAIVYAVGPIMSGESQADLFGEGVMGSTTIVKALENAKNDATVKAIVLRVDSPGGSALASDLIWRTIKSIDKPVVASMGDVAASGGYYISMGADRIFAEPGTVTGSIGVVGGKLAMKGLYEKIGIATESIARGKNSGIFSTTAKFSDDERTAIDNMMNDIYDQFRDKAAEGRHMTREQIDELAGGRVFTGRVAKRLGLVDEIGTLRDAVVAAKRLAGIDVEEKVELMLLPAPTNPLEQLFGVDGHAEREARAALAAGIGAFVPELMEPLRHAAHMQNVLREPVAVMLPYWFHIK